MNSYRVLENGSKVSFNLKYITGAASSILEELADTGRALRINDEISIDTDLLYYIQTDIDYIESEDSELADNFIDSLGLPSLFKEILDADHRGIPGYDSFHINVTYNNTPVTASGPILYDSENNVLGTLPQKLYDFFIAKNLAEEKIDSSVKMLSRHRRLLARAKKLQKEGMIRLSRFTDRKEFFEISEPVSLAISGDKENGLNLYPEINDKALTDD